MILFLKWRRRSSYVAPRVCGAEIGMTFIVMLAILSVPFLAIWILALRGAARPGGKGDTLCMVPDARVIEPQYSGAEAEKAANYSACFTSVDRELYGV